jgi:preprotein translocase subunit SecD
VHFLMQVDMRGALKQSVDTYASDARTALRDKKIRFSNLVREPQGLSLTLPDAASADAARSLLSQRLASMQWSEAPEGSAVRLSGRLLPAAVTDIQTQALKQNIETLHKRVNELGVAEPVIQQQGADRVVVQLPGVQDTARAKDIIGRTATLQIRLVERDLSQAAEVVQQRDKEGRLTDVGLKREVVATGDQLKSASATFDQNQQPAVSVAPDARGHAREHRQAHGHRAVREGQGRGDLGGQHPRRVRHRLPDHRQLHAPGDGRHRAAHARRRAGRADGDH